VIWEVRIAVPIAHNGTPHIYPPYCRFSLDDHHSHLIHTSSTDPTHHPERHPHPISRFATIHFPHRQTDMPADRQMGLATVVYRQRLRSRSMDSERRALKID